MDKNERKVCWYGALLTTLVANSAKLLALRENGIIARYWQFDLPEYVFQFVFNFIFCGILLYLNVAEGKFLDGYRQDRKWWKYWLGNFIIVVSFIFVGTLIHRLTFGVPEIPGAIGRGYIARLSISGVLVAIIVRLVLLMREGRKKDMLNAHLKAENIQAQLGLLQKQLNPHFLFNSFSSLSAIVRENPNLAQKYIVHLSRVFRNAIIHPSTKLVSVAHELETLKSYEQLILMRLENAFQLHIEVSPDVMNAQLPHLSLQPLLENASKHNAASVECPLRVTIRNTGEWLTVSNAIQPVLHPEPGTGTGLANVNERFRLLTGREIEIERANGQFIVRLPLSR